MTERKRTCKTCRYFAGEVVRECRRSPPVLHIGYDQGVWPVVETTDWCGEFAPGEER